MLLVALWAVVGGGCRAADPPAFPTRPVGLAPAGAPEAALRAQGEPAEPGLLLLGWRAELAGELAAIVRAAPPALPVAVALPQGEVATARASLERGERRILVVPVAATSPWLRDFGPLLAVSPQGGVLVDAVYGGGRAAEDGLPALLAERWGVSRRVLPLAVEGGNLVVSPQGDCFATRRVLEQNESLGAARVQAMLRQAPGCRRVRWLDRLRGELTGHADLLVAFVAGRAVLAEGAEGSPDEAVTRAASETLAATGLDGGIPLRVPLVRDAQGRALSHTQVLWLGEVLVVPAYAQPGDPPRVAAADERALALYREAFPAVGVVPVAIGRHLRELGGGLHCLGMTLPR